MTRSLVAFLLVVGALTTASARPQEFELEYFGVFESPAGEWKVLEERRTGPNPKFSFTILQNTTTGDHLSFAVYNQPGSELQTLADSAHEIFPDGRLASDEKFTIWSLRCSIIDRRAQHVLEYSFVAKHKNSEKDRLAHGYVMTGDRTVFVQHTSQRPITPELAQEISVKVLRRLVEKSNPPNLKPATHSQEPER
jgi:hypothetical protein